MPKINMIPPSTIFSPDEISGLMKRSDWKGAWEITKIWLWIIGTLITVAIFPNPFTIILALFILGGKQLACAIVMHDASHYSLFKSQKLNKNIGNFLGAWAILNNVQQYRPYHLKHHRHAGTEDDPDLNLANNFPTHFASFCRKLFRDLSGINGFKAFVGTLAIHAGYFTYSLGGKAERIKDKFTSKEKRQMAWRNLRGPILFHTIFFTICFLIGYWWLFLLWWAAYFTTFNFSLRIRSMAEHSMTPNMEDPYQNVRTTYANFFERILFAPLYVNYHVEHHLLMGVPAYNYPEMHKMLLQKGFYEKGILAKGYWTLVKKAASLQAVS
ncbi:MAG: fatty acid desaturase family protein, partial [Saprospiraceae bacterium]